MKSRFVKKVLSWSIFGVLAHLFLMSTSFAVCTPEAIRAIDEKQQRENSWIGAPTVAHFNLPDGVGCGRHYAVGSIYFHPCIGAVEVHGLIRNVWAEQGWERGTMGFPTTDELKMTDTVGRMSFFQGGVIYYHPSFGTHKMTNEFHRLWRDKGGVGTLGYPTAEMTCHLGRDVCSQSFERGSITKKIGERENMVDLRGQISRFIISVRNQDPRLTCSVHTTTFLLEYAYSQVCGFNKYSNLSEEYLNHVTNLATNRQDDGDFFHNIITGYNKYGMVNEAVVPFKTTYTYSGYQMPAGAETAGKKFVQNKFLPITVLKSINTPMGLTDSEFNGIIAALNRGVPVGLGRSHSMPIVGYRLDSSRAGGGVFIFRNSYGESVGTNGYQEEDFASVKSSASDAIFVEPVVR